jgi:hypothetical protein
MRLNRKNLLGLGILALAPILAGCCSGDGNNGGGGGTVVRVQGTIQDGAGALNSATLVPASGGAAAVVSVDGTDTNVTIASTGVENNVAADSPMAFLLQGSRPAAGTFTSGTGIQVGTVNDPAALRASAALSGGSVDGTGALNQTIALPVSEATGSDYAIGFPQGNVETRFLTVRFWFFYGRFYVVRTGARRFRVVSPVPEQINGTIPNNGENAAGHSVSCFWGSGNNGRHATLFISYGNGFQLLQAQTIANNTATFSNLAQDDSNVPANGVDLVAFIIGNRP